MCVMECVIFYMDVNSAVKIKRTGGMETKQNCDIP